MLKIRFSRKGKKNSPTYRVIVSEHTKDTYADAKENLGHYNPKTKETVLNADRIKYWLSVGAQPSATIRNLLVSQGILEGKKTKASSLSKKRAAKIEEKNKAEKEKQEEAKKADVVEEPKEPEKSEEVKEEKVEEKTEEAPKEELSESKDGEEEKK